MARDFSTAKVLFRVVIEYRYKGRSADPDSDETVIKIGKDTFGPYEEERTARGVGTLKSRWYKATNRFVSVTVQKCEPQWEDVPDDDDSDRRVAS